MTGREREVLDAIRNSRNVANAHHVFGPADVLVRIKAGSDQELAKAVKQIRLTDGVRYTITPRMFD